MVLVYFFILAALGSSRIIEWVYLNSTEDLDKCKNWSFLTLFFHFSPNWYLQLQNDCGFLSLKRFLATFWLIFSFLWYRVLEYFCKYSWTNFGQFLLTTNLATTEWTRKWRLWGKTPKWNKTKLQTTELLKQWSEQTTQKLPKKVRRLFITLTILLKNSIAQETLKFLKTQ